MTYIWDHDQVMRGLREEAAHVEAWLERDAAHIQEPLREAMSYSLLAGGKRVRPVLCLISGMLFGAERDDLMPFACALEYIHTYSLIHDDLPAMDNDDLRRGRPTNHKVFGEAAAILAGDALLTDAFGHMAGARFPAERVTAAIRLVSGFAGASGMAGGQALDMEYTGKTGVTLEALQAMHAKKTGGLLRAACVSGAVLAGAADAERARLDVYGREFGMAFQITDDILDETGDPALLGKSVGKDAKQGKITYPALVGLERSRQLACQSVEAAIAALEGFQGPQAAFLRGLAWFLRGRVA